MPTKKKSKQQDVLKQNKVFAWIAVATFGILLIPLIAMRFTDEVDWDTLDFTVMGLLIFSMASLFVLVARSLDRKHRIWAAVAFGFLFVWAWAEMAVGVLSNIGS